MDADAGAHTGVGVEPSRFSQPWGSSLSHCLEARVSEVWAQRENSCALSCDKCVCLKWVIWHVGPAGEVCVLGMGWGSTAVCTRCVLGLQPSRPPVCLRMCVCAVRGWGSVSAELLSVLRE